MYEAKSGITHHMLFETKYVRELVDMVESHNQDTFYNVFLKNVVDYHGSGASEYEIYFNFMIINHYNDVQMRLLHWKDTGNTGHEDENYDYLSCHWFMR